MSGLLHDVYEYRRLLAKCESPAGLTLDEIERFSTLEDTLDLPGVLDAPGVQTPAPAQLEAHIRGKKYVDPIHLDVFSKTGALVSDCPFLEEGQTLELRVRCQDASYRFAVAVVCAEENDDDTYDAELRFEGAPVLVRHSREFPALDLAALVAA